MQEFKLFETNAKTEDTFMVINKQQSVYIYFASLILIRIIIIERSVTFN